MNVFIRKSLLVVPHFRHPQEIIFSHDVCSFQRRYAPLASAWLNRSESDSMTILEKVRLIIDYVQRIQRCQIFIIFVVHGERYVCTYDHYNRAL